MLSELQVEKRERCSLRVSPVLGPSLALLPYVKEPPADVRATVPQ
jgi:hypothetical protein